MRRVFITGVTGQDGSYLAEQLAAEGCEVWGLLRGQNNHRREWLEELVPGIHLVSGDLLDQSSLVAALRACDPDEVYNLGAISAPSMSWNQPSHMTEVNALGCLRMLDAVRQVRPDARFVQASTAAMFSNAVHKQDEATPILPSSPYAAAKAYAHFLTLNYRAGFGLHASTAIFFNHESPRHGPEFLARKISRAVARIALGKQKRLTLGNLHPRRDWGWAPDYVSALPLIARRDEPGDYVLATGRAHSVEEFCVAAFDVVDLYWRDFIDLDESLRRPADVDELVGDAHKAATDLGWTPTVRFESLVQRLVEADLECVAVGQPGW